MKIKVVTILGANGTMGTNVGGIFASFGDAKVYMVCRDLNKANKAIDRVVKSVRADSIRKNLIPADYSSLAQCVGESDLVFESCAEDLKIKKDITEQIAMALRDDAIACSGTSGLSVTKLAECFPEKLRGNYFGVHMFNPPYNMTLCELIPTKYSNLNLMKELKEYLEKSLYRTVVQVKDSPAFLGNRIGFQFINSAMQYAEKYKDNGGIDYIDAILGSFTGRAMSPLVTADFVGLDVHRAIVDNIYKNTDDYAHDTFYLPVYAKNLVENGKLGRKSGEGLYKQEIYDTGLKRQLVYDINLGIYRDKMQYVFPYVEEMKSYIKNGDYKKAFDVLINNHSIEAELCLKFMLEYILYSLVESDEVGFDIHAADDCMATGFNWCPPLAMIEALSLVADVKTLLHERLDKTILDKIDVDRLFSNVEASRYDYRPYFKSGR